MSVTIELGGSLLGAVEELLQAVKTESIKAPIFKTELMQLESTLESVTPIFQDIKRLNRGLDRPENETKKSVEILEEGKQLVNKCSTVEQWHFFRRYRYAKKLLQLDGSILRLFQLDIQAQQRRTMSEILVGARAIAISSMGSGTICSVPDPPKITVGLDVPLKEIKKDLLKEGVKVIVVSALGGYGKTTLVMKLCKDNEVEAKFKDNIFFVMVSQTPNVKRIVQNIFNHHENHFVPEFRTDEEAIKMLEQLLKEIGSRPILLVLDDVWLGSESMLRNLARFQLPDCKILVTSRYIFPQFGSALLLNPLNDRDAMELFRRLAILPDGNSYKPDEYIVNEIVKACKGSPLALTVVSRSLCGQPAAFWKKRVKELTQGATIFHSNVDILNRLQSSVDVLDDEVKERFMDLGSFPEDQRIPATALIDMWRESYKLDEDLDVIFNLYELSNQSLINLVAPRKNTSDDGCYNDYFVTQHHLLRELIIHLNNLKPVEMRERIFIEIMGNDFDGWWLEQRQHPVKARLLSISTDEKFSSSWLNMETPEVEVVVLNMRSEKYTLPDFMGKMNKTKVLIVTNNGSSPAELNNFQLLGSSTDLRRIRLEQVSIPSFDMKTMEMKNLQKISLVRCNAGQLFRNSSFQISRTCPNLQEVDIDYCNDLMELPDGLCDIVSITKLSITNCPRLVALPKGICKLEELQVLRLASCTNLVAMPDTIGNLSKLNSLDISKCVNIKAFMTVRIGKLSNLKTLCMNGCVDCRLHTTTTNLQTLEVVKCDNKTAQNWMCFKSYLSKLRIEVVEEETNT